MVFWENRSLGILRILCDRYLNRGRRKCKRRFVREEALSYNSVSVVRLLWQTSSASLSNNLSLAQKALNYEVKAVFHGYSFLDICKVGKYKFGMHKNLYLIYF